MKKSKIVGYLNHIHSSFSINILIFHIVMLIFV